jgi:hypothetical protein
LEKNSFHQKVALMGIDRAHQLAKEIEKTKKDLKNAQDSLSIS